MHGLAEAVPLTPADEAELRLADDVAKSVESLRGWKFKQTVKKGMYSEAELRAFIEKRLAEEYPPRSSSRTRNSYARSAPCPSPHRFARR